MILRPTLPGRALAWALLTLAACANCSPIADTAASYVGRGVDSIDLGAAPNDIVVADFDGDGSPDLAAAIGAGGVAVTLARDGGFAPPRSYPAGDASSLVVGDFDGDGRLDLVVTNETGVGVLLGKGDGAFGAMRSSDAGGARGLLVAGDFNRDGKLDVAVTTPGSVRVLLGNGDGSFQPPKTQAVPEPPTGDVRLDLVVGDIDGDGTLDVLAPTRAGRLTSLLGNGDGTFRTGRTTETWDYSRLEALVGGDFDGDGKLDLAVATKAGDPGHPVEVGVMLGNGDGTFHRQGTMLFLGHGRFSGDSPRVTAADLDGDGKLDLMVDVAQSSLMATALGKGDGTLGAPVYFRVAGHVATVADVDGDGKADVLTPSDNGVAVLAGHGDGTLRAPRSFLLGTDEGGITGRVAVADFNRDGLADVALTYNNTAAASLRVLLADGHGGLREVWGSYMIEGNEHAQIAATDVDGDGILDLVASDGLYVFLGKGNGTFRQAYHDGNVGAHGIALGDFDGDGKLDAVLYRAGRPDLTMMPGKGDGTFAKERQTSVAVEGVGGAVTAADLDGDGHLDLAVSAGGSLRVLLGKGDGSFAAASTIDSVPTAAALAAADLDDDGRIDLVVAQDGEQVSTALLNAGGGAFRRAGTVPMSGTLRVADMDGDRIPDLIVLGGTLALFRGKGDGTFEVARRYAFGGSDIALGDVAGDGRPDVVLPSGNRSPFVSVLPNPSR